MVKIEEISKSILEFVPQCMLVNDDIMLVAETKEDADTKQEERKEILEGRGLRISHTKTKYLRCEFNGTKQIGEPKVIIGEEVHIQPS